jgi:hypothetical protein
MHAFVAGIDDGATDPPIPLQLIKGLTGYWLSKFITTPHILWDMFRNNPTT